MALVKTSKIGSSVARPKTPGNPAPAAVARPAVRSGAPLSKDKLSERIAAATEEMAAAQRPGGGRAASPLDGADVAGAEEAAGGSQEQVAAIAARSPP